MPVNIPTAVPTIPVAYLGNVFRIYAESCYLRIRSSFNELSLSPGPGVRFEVLCFNLCFLEEELRRSRQRRGLRDAVIRDCIEFVSKAAPGEQDEDFLSTILDHRRGLYGAYARAASECPDWLSFWAVMAVPLLDCLLTRAGSEWPETDEQHLRLKHAIHGALIRCTMSLAATIYHLDRAGDLCTLTLEEMDAAALRVVETVTPTYLEWARSNGKQPEPLKPPTVAAAARSGERR